MYKIVKATYVKDGNKRPQLRNKHIIEVCYSILQGLDRIDILCKRDHSTNSEPKDRRPGKSYKFSIFYIEPIFWKDIFREEDFPITNTGYSDLQTELLVDYWEEIRIPPFDYYIK